MKRVFRIKIIIGRSVQTLYLPGRRAREVHEALIRNGHRPAHILSVTAIADHGLVNGVGVVR